MNWPNDVRTITGKAQAGRDAPTAVLERSAGVKTRLPAGLAFLWRVVLEEIQHQMDRETFDLWLRDCRLLRVEGKVLVLGVRNDYAAEWINCRLKLRMEHTVNVLAKIMAEEGVRLPPGPYCIFAEPVRKRRLPASGVRSLR